MGSDRLNDKSLQRNLERLHRTNTPDGLDQSQAEKKTQAQNTLEDDLLSRYRNQYSLKKRWIQMFNPRFARFAFLGLAMLLLGVTACSTETSTEVEVGQQVSIKLPMDNNDFAKKGSSSADLDAQAHEILDVLAQQPGVEDVNVNMNISNGAVSVDIMIFGANLDGEALAALVRSDYPELAEATIEVEAVSGVITESWAQRFGREVFSFEVDGGSEEEIRAQILQQLADEGFQGEAEVNVTTEGDQQRIDIMMTEDEAIEE